MSEKPGPAGPPEPDARTARWGFAGGLWHGAFLAVGMSLTQPTTVIAALVAELTGSTAWVGGLTTVLSVAGALPQLLVARWIEPWPRKLPVLLGAIYLRVLSWGLLALLLLRFGEAAPPWFPWALVGLLALFYAGGGVGGVPYMDIVGKVIPGRRRGAFFGGKEALAGPLSMGAALLARRILAELPYPRDYALLFGLAAAALFVAALGFWVIREPAVPSPERRSRPYAGQLLAAARRLAPLVEIQLLTGASLMALPFYVVLARRELGAPESAVGSLLVAQVTGGVLSNLLWARLVDRRGARWMLALCAGLAAAVPLLALLAPRLGWELLLPVLFLAGAAFNGRKVGFASALLEVAPPEERPTYAALNATLAVPVAFLPLLAGLLLERLPYGAVFGAASLLVGLGSLRAALWARSGS